jgi:hypothetical protein
MKKVLFILLVFISFQGVAQKITDVVWQDNTYCYAIHVDGNSRPNTYTRGDFKLIGWNSECILIESLNFYETYDCNWKSLGSMSKGNKDGLIINSAGISFQGLNGREYLNKYLKYK